MRWQIVLTHRARRDISSLDKQIAARITSAIERFAETGHGDLISLRGRPQERRLRVGQWRVLLTLEQTSHTLTVLRVLPRDEAYRR